MNESNKPPSPEDPEADQVLRDNLRVHALSPEALARIRRATEAEWRAEHVAPSSRRGWMPYAAAAVFAFIAITSLLILRTNIPAVHAGLPLAQLARAETPGVLELKTWWRESAVNAGAALRAGQRFEARGDSLLTLRGGGNLRLAHGSRFEVLASDAVRLERGEMYVDIPPGSREARSFVAVTEAGEFRHLGTQFALSVNDGATRLRVREGRVQWQAAGSESMVDAGTEVTIDRHQAITRRDVESSGSHWSWAESMTPDIEIEDKPLAEFLDWVARDTGRTLVIADDATRQQVETIRMHGSVRGLEPLMALKAVMASTSLRLDLPAGMIRVSFAGETKTSR
jgi:ferric-dicitrate binding protein FerR (iron transport regulator)